MKVTWDYIAGFFDGEGFITTYSATPWSTDQSSFRTTIGICQSGPEGLTILSMIRDFLGGAGIVCRVRPREKPKAHYRQMYELVLTNRAAVVSFLTHMVGRVLIKHVKAQDTLRFYRVFPALRCRRTGVVNDRGVEFVDQLRIEHQTGTSKRALAQKYNLDRKTIDRHIDPATAEKARAGWRARYVRRKAHNGSIGATSCPSVQ